MSPETSIRVGDWVRRGRELAVVVRVYPARVGVHIYDDRENDLVRRDSWALSTIMECRSADRSAD